MTPIGRIFWPGWRSSYRKPRRPALSGCSCRTMCMCFCALARSPSRSGIPPDLGPWRVPSPSSPIATFASVGAEGRTSGRLLLATVSAGLLASPRASPAFVKAFPSPPGCDRMPIAFKPAVQFNPFCAADRLPPPSACLARGPPDKSLLARCHSLSVTCVPHPQCQYTRGKLPVPRRDGGMAKKKVVRLDAAQW